MSAPERITVVGAGLMGHGIAQIFAAYGHAVWLVEKNSEVLNTAKDRVRANLTNMAEHGIEFGRDVDGILDHISTTDDLPTACEDCDYVFEAVFENLELKQQIFADLDRLCPRKAILCSNTSVMRSPRSRRKRSTVSASLAPIFGIHLTWFHWWK